MRTRKLPGNERGAVLITALVFIVALTILALNALQDVTLQQKMTSAHNQRALAHQAALSALRDAEGWLGSQQTVVNANLFGTTGIFRVAAANPGAFLWNAGSDEFGGLPGTSTNFSIAQLPLEPRLQIKESDLPNAGTGLTCSYGATTCANTSCYQRYIITSAAELGPASVYLRKTVDMCYRFQTSGVACDCPRNPTYYAGQTTWGPRPVQNTFHEIY